MTKPLKPIDECVSDSASAQTLKKAREECIETCFTRLDLQTPVCKFGKDGLCCRICYMGPCRITSRSPLGVCGADAATIVARNFLREVVGGTAAHSDHGRHLVLLLKKVAEGNGGGYEIKDEKALRYTARLYGINEADKNRQDLALELAELFLKEFTSQEEPLKTLSLSPRKQQNNWNINQVLPLGIDRMVVESMHRSHMGVDHDYKNLLLQAFRTSLADGWGGSRIATIISDILFGSPQPVRSSANLGVLDEKTVNIVVHGHEPELSEMLAIASKASDIIDYARKAGASGLTLAGICCTANEILMRHGIPVAGNFLQQELAIVTGAIEMMVIDVQCCMPGLAEVSGAYHTKIVSTSDMARTIGASHFSFDGKNSLDSAKKLLKMAIDNYKNRDPQKVAIPAVKESLVAGFSVEAIKYMLGGKFRASFRPLNDAIIQGRILGLAGIVGCNNPRYKMDDYINTLTAELIKKNILVVKTGCAAIASAKQGILTPEAALQQAGPGLREVCEAVGIPPVLHMGSCVDNSRILEAGTEIVAEGGLGEDLSQAPVVGVAPEWMSEKAVAIASYFVASGIDVILGHPFRTPGSKEVTRFLENETKKRFGGSFHVCPEPNTAAETTVKILNQRREKLGIHKKVKRKLMDMKDRRELDV